MPELNIDINFKADTGELEEAQATLQELQGTAEEISDSTTNISSDGIEQMGASASETAENVQQASDAMGELGNKTDEANEKMNETVDSSASLGTAIAGLAGAAGFDMMITKADNVQASWNRLSLTFDGTGVSMDTLKNKVSEVSNSTGKAGGTVRDYFNQMGIAGITNTDLIGSSFTALAGKAYQTNNSIESMSQKLNSMVMTGTASGKMLKGLGLTTEDLGNALGVTADEASDTFKSLSESERLQALTTAMGDGAKANELYKNSYAGLKEQAEASMGGLMASVGSSILPVVIPAMNMAKGAVDAFTGVIKGMPGPVMSVFGALGGGVVAVTTLVGVLGTLGKVGSSVVSGLKSIKSGYDAMKSAMQGAKTVIDMVRNGESLLASVKTVLSGAEAVETGTQSANAAAKSAAIGPTTGLAIAENSLLLPLLLLVGAVLAVVAVMWYLYNNNEQVREAVDNLVASVGAFVGLVVGAVQGAITGFVAWLRDLYLWLGQLSTQVANAVNGAITYLSGIIVQIITILTNIWTTVVNWFTQLLSMSPQQVALLVLSIITALNPLAGLVATTLARVLPVFISQATSWITNTVSRARNLVSQVYSALSSLPSRVASAVSGVLGALTRPFTQAWSQIQDKINMIKDGIRTISGGMIDLGFDGDFGYDSSSDFGFSGSLNDTLSNTISNKESTVQNTFNINGIIEETASEYIVQSVNNHLRKQNLIRGV